MSDQHCMSSIYLLRQRCTDYCSLYATISYSTVVSPHSMLQGSRFTLAHTGDRGVRAMYALHKY